MIPEFPATLNQILMLSLTDSTQSTQIDALLECC